MEYGKLTILHTSIIASTVEVRLDASREAVSNYVALHCALRPGTTLSLLRYASLKLTWLFGVQSLVCYIFSTCPSPKNKEESAKPRISFGFEASISWTYSHRHLAATVSKPENPCVRNSIGIRKAALSSLVEVETQLSSGGWWSRRRDITRTRGKVALKIGDVSAIRRLIEVAFLSPVVLMALLVMP